MLNTFDEIDKNERGTLTVVTEELYHYAMGVVPPIYKTGCWAMGEPYTENVYYWFKQVGEKFYCVFGTYEQALEGLNTGSYILIDEISFSSISLKDLTM